MTRAELEKYISENFGIDGDHPFEGDTDSTVFRHRENRKWFALVMNIGRSRLGLKEEGDIDICNFKCDPLLLGSFLMKKGFFPAYHMSKTNWITAALDGSAEEEDIKALVDISFELTLKKKK